MTDPTTPAGKPTTAPIGADANAAAAAALRPLLQGQAQRLRSRYLWHGLCLGILLPAAAILLFFGLDHTLRLPLPIRLLHTAATVGLFGYAMWQFVRYPLSRTFADVDMAQLLERRFPALHQRLVSAVQLRAVADAELRNQSRAMIDRLLAESAATVQALPLDHLFDPRPTRRVFAGAAVLCTALGLGAYLSPDTARAFVLRHLGIAADYPRQTRLVVEVPPAGPEVQRIDRPGTIELVLAAGADLHVSVLAEGVVPKEVFLDVEPQREASAGPAAAAEANSRSITMSPRPGNRFRHVFRRLSGSFSFHARGGDDDTGDQVVLVRTVHPPQVAELRASIVPPAYTGVLVIEQKGGAIEALVGSEVELSVSTTAPVQQATLVFLENGKRLALQPVDIQDDGGKSLAYRGKFTIEGSDRYQIDLTSDSGLHNPNPGTYPIAALQDYAPVGRWLLPDDESTLLLPTGILCVRLDVHDDFGLTSVELGVDHSSGRSLQKALLAAPPAPAAGAPASKAPNTLLLTELLEVRDLLQGTKGQNEGLSLQLVVRDNRQPEAGRVELPRRIVQIVDAQQLAESIARAFRGLREEATQALEVQTDRRARLEELLQRAPGSGADTAQVLTGVEVGQSRVLASCERLHRGLMRAFDVHLWNRLETSQHQAAVVDLYRAFSATLAEPAAQVPAFYRDLSARRAAGTLGAMETTLDPILGMIAVADQLVSTDGPKAARLLMQAQVARPGADWTATVQQTMQVQDRIQQALQQLLLRLDMWNTYQDLVQEVRALRDRQRDLEGRTEEARGKK